MNVETWNKVAGWGIDTIKNVQTHVGLTDEVEAAPPALSAAQALVLCVSLSNDECVRAPLPTVAGQLSEVGRKEEAWRAQLRGPSFKLGQGDSSSPLAMAFHQVEDLVGTRHNTSYSRPHH